MGSGRGRSVLLVDDDVDLRFVANIALTRVGGFDVTGVGSVAAARAALGTRAPDGSTSSCPTRTGRRLRPSSPSTRRWRTCR